MQRRRLRLAELSAPLRPASLRALVSARRDHLAHLGSRLSPRALEREIAAQGERLTRLSDRLNSAQTTRIERLRQRLESADRLRETLGYKATLARGYAVVRDDQGALLTTRAQAAKAAALQIEFADGTLDTGGAPAKPASKPKQKPPEQGSLF